MSKKNKFAVGDRVGYAMMDKYENEWDSSPKLVPIFISDYMEEPDYGVVTDVLSNGNVKVKWDPNACQEDDEEYDPAHLLAEAALKAKLVTLDKEFKETTKLIKEKMKEAAALVKDANKLAKKTGNNLEEMYDAVHPLVNAMDSAGWRSSSWGC